MFVVAALITASGALALAYRGHIRILVREHLAAREALPPAQSYKEVVNAPPPTPTPSPTPTPRANTRTIPAPPTPAPVPSSGGAAIPALMNLDAPFTSQAPDANWQLPFKEACEEASMLMVDAFYQGKTFTQESAKAAILKMVDFEKRYFGYYEDTNAAETAELARAYFGYGNARLVPGPITADMIKREIAAGRPVIVPAAGRMLGNPYYTPPGPYYHMLVIKGYTTTEFITNDPGTRRGKDFRYSYATLLNAIHDYNPERIADMPQAMIVIVPDHN